MDRTLTPRVPFAAMVNTRAPSYAFAALAMALVPTLSVLAQGSGVESPAAPAVEPSAETAPSTPEEPLLDFSQQAPVMQPPEASTPAPSAASLPSAPVYPQPAPETTRPVARPIAATRPAPPNVISLSPLGLVFGKVRLNYERTFADRHGFLAEVVVTPQVLTGFDFVSAGGGFGYRWYWSGPRSSGFVGAHVAWEQGAGKLKAVVDEEERIYRGKVRRLSIVPAIGKRWLFTEHWLMTLRVGVGYAATRYIPDSNADREAVAELRRFARRLPIAIEAELSLGYRF